MKDVGQRTAEATALKHAVPYIRIFKGKTFVLKAGGGALEREETARRWSSRSRRSTRWLFASCWCTAAAPNRPSSPARLAPRPASSRGGG